LASALSFAAVNFHSHRRLLPAGNPVVHIALNAESSYASISRKLFVDSFPGKVSYKLRILDKKDMERRLHCRFTLIRPRQLSVPRGEFISHPRDQIWLKASTANAGLSRGTNK